MAQVLNEWPEPVREDGKYKWSEWTDGQIWGLIQGVDFTSSIQAFRQTAAKAAIRKELNLTTRKFKTKDGKEGLAIQFSRPATPAKRRSGGARQRAK